MMTDSRFSIGLSICVVLYRAEEGSIRFHQELMESLKYIGDCEVLYYDNSPTDTLRVPLQDSPYGTHVSYIHDDRNLGFSYANNQLILESRQRKILLLNPDVYGFNHQRWIDIAALDVHLCARFVRLLNPDGSFQDCVGDVVSLLRPFRSRLDYQAMREPTQVGMGIMAFMLTEKQVFARVGLLDCDYRLYSEDMDWCYRSTSAGYPCIFDPRIELEHTGGASAIDRWSRSAAKRRKYRAERVFIDKHFSGASWLAMRALNLVKLARTGFGN